MPIKVRYNVETSQQRQKKVIMMIEDDMEEKIDFKKIEKITKLIFLTAWEIANRDERPKLNN